MTLESAPPDPPVPDPSTPAAGASATSTGDPGLAGWSQWVPPGKPATPNPVGEQAGRPPGAVAIIARGIDLNASMSSEIRRASLYAGFMYLATIGPIAALLIGVVVRAGGLAGVIDALQFDGDGRLPALPDIGRFGGLVFVLGVTCFALVSVDLQIVATAMIGGRAADRSVDLRTGLGIARRAFWRVTSATLVVGLILVGPRLLFAQAIRQSTSEISLLTTTVIDVLLSAPFVYLGTAVILGGGTPLRAIGASWRVARRRWRLAIVIGIVNAAVSFIALFALSAGLDVLSRIGTALDLGSVSGATQAAELTAIVTFGLIAGGSLTMTIATLTTAPAVVAWLGLGGTLHGLPDSGAAPGPAASPPATHRRPRLISRPMQVTLVAEIGLALLSLVGRG